jgi:hypothetical protein
MSYGLPLLGNARSVRGDQFQPPNSSGRGGPCADCRQLFWLVARSYQFLSPMFQRLRLKRSPNYHKMGMFPRSSTPAHSHNSFLWRQLTAVRPIPNARFLSPECPHGPCPGHLGWSRNPSCSPARRMRSSRLRSSTLGTVERTAKADAK